MDEWSASKPDRVAIVIWDRLLGYFGDALLRRFGKDPPTEWVEAIDALNRFQLERGMRRLKFGGKGGAPSLPEFMRLCRAIADDGIEEGPRPLALPAPQTGNFDGWDIAANNRFWKYVTKRLTDAPRAWGPPNSTQQAEATQIGVAYKNAWAQDMREACTVDPVSGEIVMPSNAEQSSTWINCMGRVEADILLLMRGKAA